MFLSDYSPEIYNTFTIRWGASFENELEATFEKHKELFGERRTEVNAVYEVPVNEVITDENDDPIKDSIGNSLTTLKSQEVLDETFIEFGEIHANPIGIVHYTGTIEIGFIIE